MQLRQSRSGKLEDVFVGEGEFDLHLPIEQLINLQEKTGKGPSALLASYQDGTWFVDHLIETIRLALIGGGMSKKDAFALVKRNIDSGYLLEAVTIAQAILFATLSGVPDEVPDAGELPAPPVMETPTAS